MIPSRAVILSVFYSALWIPRARKFSEDRTRLGVFTMPSCWQIESDEVFMKSESFVVNGILDRVATAEEIRNAMESFHDPTANSANETPLEIPSDRGGYIRISAEELDLVFLICESNQHEK